MHLVVIVYLDGKIFSHVIQSYFTINKFPWHLNNNNNNNNNIIIIISIIMIIITITIINNTTIFFQENLFEQTTSKFSVLHKVFWAPVLRTSGSWNLPVRMAGSLVPNFNNYYVLLIHVFDGCSNRFDLCDHFNLVCCCLSPVLISDKRSCWKISQSLKPIWLDVEMLVPLF